MGFCWLAIIREPAGVGARPLASALACWVQRLAVSRSRYPSF